MDRLSIRVVIGALALDQVWCRCLASRVCDEWRAVSDPRLGVRPDWRLFVRWDGSALNQQFVDGLLRRRAATSGVAAPDGAMAHALRHSFGMELALRGVPLPVRAAGGAGFSDHRWCREWVGEGGSYHTPSRRHVLRDRPQQEERRRVPKSLER